MKRLALSLVAKGISLQRAHSKTHDLQQIIKTTIVCVTKYSTIEIWQLCITTYNVLLRYLAFVSRCYSLLPTMLKIFDVICQLAEFLWKKYIFHILVGFYPSKSVRAFSLLLLICKWQFSVSGQIFFNRADKNKSTVSVLCLFIFRPCFIIWVTLTYLITAINKN